MHELNADRSLAHGRSNALDAAGAHVARGEYPRYAALQQVRRTWQAPACIRQLFLAKVGPSLHEAMIIQHYAALQPSRIRLRARHQEYVPEIRRFEFSITVRPGDALQSIGAVERRQLRVRMQADVRVSSMRRMRYRDMLSASPSERTSMCT